MTLMFRFTAGRKYLVDSVPYTYLEAYDAERNDPGSGNENAYIFRHEQTQSPERWLESEVKAKRGLIKERGTGEKVDLSNRPVDLKPSEKRIEAVLRAYDAAPFPLRKKAFLNFVDAFRRDHPNIPPPTLRQFKAWVRKRGETGCRSARDFRDGRGRHPKRRLATKIAWGLKRVVVWYFSARHRTRIGAVRRLATFIRKLRSRTLRFEGERAASLVKMPANSTIYAAIAKAKTAELVETKTSNREASTERGVRVSLPDVKKHLDLVAIDSTMADEWLVFVPDLLIFLRRPIVSLAIDAWSGCIMAALVTWRDDLEAVFHTMKMSIRPKDTLIGGRPHLDPANVFGLAQCYLIDNALKQTGKSLQDGADDAGSSVHWAPKKNPQYKAIVERPMNSLNTMCLHVLPNAIPYDVTALRRLGYDPKTDGKPILIQTLQEHLLDFVARYNEIIDAERMRSHKLLWDLSCSMHGFDTFGDVDLLDDAFAQVETVTITRSGVEWNGLRFHDPDTVTQLLDSMGGTNPPDDFEVTRRGRRSPRQPPRVTTKAKVLESDLSVMKVFDYVRGRYVPLPCTLKLPDMTALDAAFIEEYKAYAKAQQIAFRTDEDILVAADGYHRRLENSDMVRRIKASRVSSKLGQDIGPMPGKSGVLRVVAEPGATAMRQVGEVVVEPMAPHRGDAFRPVVGPRRGGSKKAPPAPRGRVDLPRAAAAKASGAIPVKKATVASLGGSRRKPPNVQSDEAATENQAANASLLDARTLLFMSLR